MGEARATNRIAQLGAEDAGQGPAGDEKLGMHGSNPALAVSPTAGRDEDMDVRMVDHGAGPGVKDGEQAGTGSEVARIVGEFQERFGSRDHEEAVEDLLVRACEGTKLSGEREGDQEVGAGQEAAALPVEPSPGLIGVALWTMPVAARVVTVASDVAVVARAEMSPEGRRSARLDVPHGRPMRRQHALTVGLPIGGPRFAEDVREFQHGASLLLEALHQPVDRIDGGLMDLLCEMGVDLRRPGAGVAEVGLDETQGDAVFEELSSSVGDYLRRMPDGETGERLKWIVFQQYNKLLKN